MLVRRPRLFIVSSLSGQPIAENIHIGLDDDVDCATWFQGIFRLSAGNLDNLIEAGRSTDFAALVLTPEDMAERESVSFELGLFLGALGPSRTFVVCSSDQEIALPADVAGVTIANHETREDGNWQAALEPVCALIRSEIEQVVAEAASRRARIAGEMGDGVRPRRRSESLGIASAPGPREDYRIANISVTGALLETKGEIAVGKSLDLELQLKNGYTAQVTAEVVRVQFPDWGLHGGVGVAFTGFKNGSREAIEAYVEAVPVTC